MCKIRRGLPATVFLLVGLIFPTGLAQQAAPESSGDIATDIALTRAVIKERRQAIVAMNMQLSEPEAGGFWPVYRNYRNEAALLGDRFIAIITDYAKVYENLSEAQAARLTDDFLKLQEDQLQLKMKYVKRFRKVLPEKQVARFFQIENKLDAIVNYDLADTIPMLH